MEHVRVTDHRIHPVLPEGAVVEHLPFGAVVRPGDQQPVADLLRGALDGAQQQEVADRLLAVELHPDRLRRQMVEDSGAEIRDIIELPRDFPDLLGLRPRKADSVLRPVEHGGDRPPRDPGARRDIDQPNPFAFSPHISSLTSGTVRMPAPFHPGGRC